MRNLFNFSLWVPVMICISYLEPNSGSPFHCSIVNTKEEYFLTLKKPCDVGDILIAKGKFFSCVAPIMNPIVRPTLAKPLELPIPKELHR